METVEQQRLIEQLTQADGPFPLIEREWNGSTVRAYDRPPRTLRDVFLATRAFADREAVLYQDERWTYAQQWSYAVRLAHGLRERYDVQPGARIAIACRNFPEWVFVFWAVQLLGAAAVPLNAWFTGAELERLLYQSDPALIFADAERLERLSGSTAVQSSPVIGIRAEGLGAATAIEDIIQDRDENEPPDIALGADDIATILFTSGTTGTPKAVAGTHLNHVSALLNRHLRLVAGRVSAGQDIASAIGHRSGEVKLTAYPLFHVAGISTMYAATYNGHALALMRKWETTEAIRIIAAEKVSELSGPPLAVQNIVDAAAGHAGDLAGLKTLGCGGASAPAKLMGQIHKAFGGQVTPRTAYGMTETTSGIIALAGQELIDNPDSIGRPSPTIDLRTIDETGRDVPAGSPGELAIRGPQVFSGYVGDEKATQASFVNGWFRTGDTATIDESGLVRIVGRSKDIVIRGGENIHCAEVEACLSEHPDILEAAAFGIPHPTFGEELTMMARARKGSVADPQGLRRFMAERLAAFKVPVRIVLTDTPLPRTASGKIVKRNLASLAEECAEAG